MVEKNISTLLTLTHFFNKFALEEVGVQVQIPAGLLPFFFVFFFHRILLFSLFLFIPTADPFRLREILLR